MEKVPGPMVALARWSGRVDLRPLLALRGWPALLEAPAATLLGWGLPPALVQAMASTGAVPGPAWALGAAAYPAALLDLENPPPVLWHRGDTAALHTPGITLVGSRGCTPYGKEQARRLAQAVVGAGGAIVSGAARGIDAAAHAAALEAGGLTLAVLGAGLDHAPGPEARALHRAILEGGGLLLSEMPPADPPDKWTFPRRNRLVAALGVCTVVLEAAERSGALSTAAHARALGRPLLALPGRVDAPASAGCNRMILNGEATLLMDAEPLVRHLRDRHPLLSLLDRPASNEELALRAGLPLREVLAATTALELAGVLKRGPGGRWTV